MGKTAISRPPAPFGSARFAMPQSQGARAKIGPNLYGIAGAKAGTDPDFAYSSAMRNADLIWTADILDAFIENPQSVIRGNRMSFTGEPDIARRQEIIDYLFALDTSE